MKIKLQGKNLDDIRPLMASRGILETADAASADAVIAYGGDGSLLGAIRDFPQLPVVAIRDAATAPTCELHEAGKVLDAMLAGSLNPRKLPRLCASAPGGRIFGVNDLFLHNSDRRSSVRYQVRIDGEIYADEVRGDGVCFASVHGSSAYYRSITRGMFRTGLGLAFSNSIVDVDHLVLEESSIVELTVIRGPGMVIADNAPGELIVNAGETVEFRQLDETVTIWGLDGFMCSKCRKLRHGI